MFGLAPLLSLLCLLVSPSCATESSTAFLPAAERADTKVRLEDRITLRKQSQGGELIVIKRPCEMDDGSRLRQMPELKAGVIKKIGAKRVRVFIEYDCGTAPLD